MVRTRFSPPKNAQKSKIKSCVDAVNEILGSLKNGYLLFRTEQYARHSGERTVDRVRHLSEITNERVIFARTRQKLGK